MRWTRSAVPRTTSGDVRAVVPFSFLAIGCGVVLGCSASSARDRGPEGRLAASGSAGALGAAAPERDGAADTTSGDLPSVASASATIGPADKPVDTRPRITSIGMGTWIYPTPVVDRTDFLGTVRQGTSIAVKSLDTVKGDHCAEGFYEAEPRGYICKDHTVTTSPPALFMAVDALTHPRSGPMPYEYALSDGAPMYNRVPTAAEIKRVETYMGKPHVFEPLYITLRSHEEMARSDAIPANAPLPSFLEAGGAVREKPYDLVERTIPRGSMLSWVTSFEADGRTYLLGVDHTIIPADRVRRFEQSKFHGTKLGQGGSSGVSLPIAWARVKARPQYELGEGATIDGDTVPEGAMVANGAEFAVRSFVEVTTRWVTMPDGKKTRRFLETKATGARSAIYMEESDATLAEATVDRPMAVQPGQKWMVISLLSGTLVAYEDMTPVFATLIAPGAGGLPIQGGDPVKNSTTPLGSYTITFKDRASTMSPETGENRKFWISDVPYTQYFNAPFALHGAFWHERFGELVSAGCVNLSPIDAEYMFGWTDPPVPDEWQGATGAAAPENGPSTIVIVKR